MYYDPGFELPEESRLRTDGLYFRVDSVDKFGDLYDIFRFYPDGLLLQYRVYNAPDRVANLTPMTEGNIHGYYHLERDSLNFSTKVFYDHRPVFYTGKAWGDSLRLEKKSGEGLADTAWIYYFFKR